MITDRRKQRKFNLLNKRNFFSSVKWIQKVSSREKLPFVGNELSIDYKMRPNKHFELWFIKGHIGGQQFSILNSFFRKKKIVKINSYKRHHNLRPRWITFYSLRIRKRNEGGNSWTNFLLVSKLAPLGKKSELKRNATSHFP